MRRGLCVLAAIAALLGATACGGDSVTVKTPDGSVEIDADGSDFTIEGDDGSIVEGGTELPDDFPEEIALVEGRVIQAIKAGSANGGGFSVSVEREGALDEVFGDAAQLLREAGFTEEGSQSAAGSLASAMFGSTDWKVLLAVTESGDDGKVFVNYTVAAATA